MRLWHKQNTGVRACPMVRPITLGDAKKRPVKPFLCREIEDAPVSAFEAKLLRERRGRTIVLRDIFRHPHDIVGECHLDHYIACFLAHPSGSSISHWVWGVGQPRVTSASPSGSPGGTLIARTGAPGIGAISARISASASSRLASDV